MQDRRNAPLAQERQIVSVEVMAYEHLARTGHRLERFHQSAVAAADRIGGDNIPARGERLSRQSACRLIDAKPFADFDYAEVRVSRSERATKADLPLLLAAETVAAERRQNSCLPIAEPLADQIGSRLAGSAIIHSDIGRTAAVGDVRHERDDRNAASNGAVHGSGDFRLVGRLEKEAMSSARCDPVDERRQIGDPRDLGEVVARAKHRGAQPRHLVLERRANGFRKAVGRLHDDIDQEFAPGQPRLFDLAMQLADRLLDALGRMLAHPAALVENPIDRRLAEAGLKRNLLDEKRVSHDKSPDGFLME